MTSGLTTPLRRLGNRVRRGFEAFRAAPDEGRAAATGGAPPAPTTTWVPPGHFYSPIVDVHELHRHRDVVFDRKVALPGIDLRVEEQLAMVARLARHYPALPFRERPTPGLRFHYDNPAFGHGDGIVLGCMLAELRPRRLLEFGSGYSSCAALDVAERLLDGDLDCTFVDPYPELLRSLHGTLNPARQRIIESRAQDVDLGLVDSLGAGDVLFIDSTHVSKAGSDVNFHLFTVLPRLRSGVHIHFHDIFYPFEYPEAWFFDENRSWNELYLMHAFLMHNKNYEITIFNNYLGREHIELMETALPLFMRNAGASMWFRKI